MKSVAQVLLVIAILCATFAVYYYSRSHSSSESAVRLYFQNKIPISPTICTFKIGEFDTTLSGTLHLKGAQMRADFAQAVRGVIDHVHVVTDASDKTYAWSDERREFGLDDVALDFTRAPLDCSIWWKSDDTIFVVPQSIATGLR